MKNGETVFYSTGRAMVRARVETVHRDATVSVKALFYVDDKGNDVPGYLGFKVRLASWNEQFTPPFSGH